MFKLKQEPPTPCSVPSHDEPLKYFCETCDNTICRDCAILTHKGHEYKLMADSYTKHYEDLEQLLVPVKEKISTVKNMLSILTKREIDVGERGERVLEEIHEMVEEMIGDLHQSERKLTDQAKRVTSTKLKQKQAGQLSLEHLEQVENYVEKSLKTGTPPQILSSKEQMKKHMNEITTLISAEDLLPKVEADIVLSKDVRSLRHIGDIISGTALYSNAE
uniref:B box-type domain-containing protein n=1 Tax=Amphimedon queenslandica TaxID=400682 RepID=A0A1X7U6B9_AMPQE